MVQQIEADQNQQSLHLGVLGTYKTSLARHALLPAVCDNCLLSRSCATAAGSSKEYFNLYSYMYVCMYSCIGYNIYDIILWQPTAIYMYVCTWVATYIYAWVWKHQHTCVHGHNQVWNGQALPVPLWVSIPHTHTFFTYKPTALNTAPWNVNRDRSATGDGTGIYYMKAILLHRPCKG